MVVNGVRDDTAGISYTTHKVVGAQRVWFDLIGAFVHDHTGRDRKRLFIRGHIANQKEVIVIGGSGEIWIAGKLKSHHKNLLLIWFAVDRMPV